MHRRVVTCVSIGALVLTSALTTPPAAAVRAASPAVVSTSAAGTYTALPPARVLDTRKHIGDVSTPGAYKTITVQIGGHGGVPSTGVSAVALNLTVTGAAKAGYLTAYAGGVTTRPTASNINFLAGRTTANLAIVPVDTQGRIQIYNGAGGATPVIGDVAGYYVGGQAEVPGSFTALTPTRVLDTRHGTGNVATPGPNSTITVAVGGQGKIPATGVRAVAVNLTVTASTRGGYLSAYAGDAPSRPTTSNVNFSANITVANLAVVPVGSDGTIKIYNGSAGSTPIIADVAGYYRTGDATDRGAYTSVDPARVLDTRKDIGHVGGNPGADATITVQVGGNGGVPAAGVSAVVVNLTVTASTRGGFLTAYAGDATSRPATSNVNFTANATVANLAVVPVSSDGAIKIYNGSPGTTPIVADVAGYYRGSDWAYTELPTTPPSNLANGIDCTSATTCIAAGTATDTDNNSVAAVSTLHGTTWTTAKLPTPAGDDFAALNAVSCASGTACVAVGAVSDDDGTVPLVQYFDGTKWTASVLAQIGDSTSTQLLGVSCTSDTACVAVGKRDDVDNGDTDGFPVALALTRNAGSSTWQGVEQDVGVPSGFDGAELLGISCVAAGSCVAVGDTDGYVGNADTEDYSALVETLSDGGWNPTVVASPDGDRPDGQLSGVSCTAATSCVAVGAVGTGGIGTKALTVAFDGHAATSAVLDDADGHDGGALSSVWCTDAQDCTAVGNDYAGDQDGRMVPLAPTLTGDAASAADWTPDHPPLDSVSDPDGSHAQPDGGLVSVSCTTATHCVAVGNGGLTNGNAQGFAESRGTG